MKALAIVGCCAVAYALVALGAYLALMTALAGAEGEPPGKGHLKLA